MKHICCFLTCLEPFTKAHSSSILPSSAGPKRLWQEINYLRMASICKGASRIFILDKTSLDDDYEEECSSSKENFIIGRILPHSDIYKQHAFKIEIRIPLAYPFSPPEVRVITPIYHPNVGNNGRVFHVELISNYRFLSLQV